MLEEKIFFKIGVLFLVMMGTSQPPNKFPRNRILVTTGNEIECNPLLPIIYNLSDTWYTISKKAQTTLPPRILSPQQNHGWNFEFAINIGSSGIYSKEQLEEFSNKIILTAERDAIENTMVNTIYNPGTNRQGLLFGHLFDDNALEQTKEKIAEMLWGKFSKLGIFFSGIIGIFTVIKLIAFFIEWAVNSFRLYRLFGVSTKLLAAFSNAITELLFQKTLFQTEEPKQDENKEMHSTIVQILPPPLPSRNKEANEKEDQK